MNKLLKSSIIFCLLTLGSIPASNVAQSNESTVINDVTIRKSRTLMIPGKTDASERTWLFVVSGKVDFSGPGPVYVTVKIGDDNYNTVTTPEGDFSVIGWNNGANATVKAWAKDSL